MPVFTGCASAGTASGRCDRARAAVPDGGAKRVGVTVVRSVAKLFVLRNIQRLGRRGDGVCIGNPRVSSLAKLAPAAFRNFDPSLSFDALFAISAIVGAL